MADAYDTPTDGVLADDIDPWFLPSEWNAKHFGEWYIVTDGHDHEGNFNGFCRLHDTLKQTEGSAVYNFKKGIMRCQGDPSCHPGKRAMSLSNVLNKLASL